MGYANIRDRADDILWNKKRKKSVMSMRKKLTRNYLTTLVGSMYLQIIHRHYQLTTKDGLEVPFS